MVSLQFRSILFTIFDIVKFCSFSEASKWVSADVQHIVLSWQKILLIDLILCSVLYSVANINTIEKI
jgi:hypothetical protein